MTYNGWVIYNGYLPSNKFFDYANMIHEAATYYGHESKLFKNNELISFLENLSIQSIDADVTLPDYVVFTDKDVYLAKQLELLGVPVYNSSQAIEISDDKIKTYQILGSKNIPIPKTIFAPKTYGNDIDHKFVETVKHIFPFPFIVKEAFGSFGEQVYLVKNERDLTECLHKVNGKPFMFQQFISTSFGKDIRLQVVGDEVVAAMKRTSEGDFRANVTSGAKMEPYKPDEREKKLAIEATKAIGAHFAGVDLLFGEHSPIVCEINSNAHIRNLLDCTGINVAFDLIKFIENDLRS